MVRVGALASGCAAMALVTACGGGGSAPAKASTPVPTFTYSASGVSPGTLSVAPGGHVVVHNSDAVNHGVEADDLQKCPELIGSIVLLPGEEWDWSGFKGGPKTCAFHDQTRSGAGGAPDPAFSATIDVSAQ
jgi:hypothetical protein